MKKGRALGTGLTWAFAWAFVGTTFMWLLGVDPRATIDMSGDYMVMGLFGGAAFSIGRRRFEEMSLPRVAAWGAVGGLLLLVLFRPETLVAASIATLLAAGSAAGSLALVRRADEMSLPRFAAWAGVGGLLLSILLFSVEGGFSLANVAMIGFLALMSAGCAASSLTLARNAHDEDLLGAGGSTGKIEGE